MKISGIDPASLDDEAFDALFIDLPRPTPALHLQQQVLQRIHAELKPKRSFWIAATTWGVGAAMLGALGVTLLPETTEVGDPGQFIERGIPGQPTQRIRLEAAIQGQDRLIKGQAYPAGTVIIFQVQAQEAGTYTLKHNGKEIDAGTLKPGTNLLSVGYALEADDEESTFLLESGGVTTTLIVPAPVQP